MVYECLSKMPLMLVTTEKMKHFYIKSAQPMRLRSIERIFFLHFNLPFELNRKWLQNPIKNDNQIQPCECFNKMCHLSLPVSLREEIVNIVDCASESPIFKNTILQKKKNEYKFPLKWEATTVTRFIIERKYFLAIARYRFKCRIFVYFTRMTWIS